MMMHLFCVQFAHDIQITLDFLRDFSILTIDLVALTRPIRAVEELLIDLRDEIHCITVILELDWKFESKSCDTIGALL